MAGAWGQHTGCDESIAGGVHLTYDPKTGIDRITTEFASMACATCNNNDGSCGCVSNFKEQSFGTRVVWTKGGTAGASARIHYWGGEDGLPIAPTIGQMQATVTVKDQSDDFETAVGYQVSADRATWDTPVYFGANGPSSPEYQAGDGTTTYAWVMASGNLKRYIRFFTTSRQVAGTVVAIANVSVSVGFLIR